MFKISHEVPLCLLEESKIFNDYQYALVHLLEENEEYRNHFIKCRDEGIPIYLDNSLHELKVAIGGQILLKWINILKPECIFVPDVWQNATESIINAREWSKIEVPDGVNKVAVVQGNSFEDIILCYQTYRDLGYTKIAFSYGADYYLDHSSHFNPSIARALGRVEVINRLYKAKTILDTHKIHLLGTSCPFEFSLYKNMPFIDSIDTSNPIMMALDNIKYNSLGIHDKPKSNMNEHFYINENSIDLNLVNYNTYMFKNIVINE